MKQFTEAAHLYENGNYYDKAAFLYIKVNNGNLPNPLAPLSEALLRHSEMPM